MDGEEKDKEEEEEEGVKKDVKGEKKEVQEKANKEGVTKVDIVLDCQTKKSDANDVCCPLYSMKCTLKMYLDIKL